MFLGTGPSNRLQRNPIIWANSKLLKKNYQTNQNNRIFTLHPAINFILKSYYNIKCYSQKTVFGFCRKHSVLGWFLQGEIFILEARDLIKKRKCSPSQGAQIFLCSMYGLLYVSRVTVNWMAENVYFVEEPPGSRAPMEEIIIGGSCVSF